MHCDVMVGGTDEGYIRALVEFLLQSKKNQFNIVTISSSEELRDVFADPRFSLFLIEESLMGEIGPEDLPDRDRLLVLTEPITGMDTRQVRPVLKYQKASDIEGMMVECISNHSDHEMVRAAKKTKLVTFYSPSGGTGCSTLAQIYSGQRAGKGFKTLHVSLDAFQSHDLVYESLQSKNLSDYMVHILSGNNWLMGLEQMVAVDEATGVHYLRGVNHQLDMSDFDSNLWVEWFNYLHKRSDYDYIVIDTGRNAFSHVLKLLEVSDHRVYIGSNDPIGRYKWQSFFTQLEAVKGQNLLCNNTVFARDVGEVSGRIETYDVILPEDRDIFREGKEGGILLNPHSQTYRQVEVVMAHV